ncbi:MAG: Veg family protein, partial [Acetomicrobium sp.]
MSEKLVDIREKLASHIGARVRYRQSKGRRKAEEHEG